MQLLLLQPPIRHGAAAVLAALPPRLPQRHLLIHPTTAAAAAKPLSPLSPLSPPPSSSKPQFPLLLGPATPPSPAPPR
ncbi:hypothetical protein Syun_015183 [Stephania yunnanensis]|uniref:Uncharacterized protein n=1 Tax=Stephania yunnanensis TaxID=152371 RepID=A0AAP0JKQ6_9MAGN